MAFQGKGNIMAGRLEGKVCLVTGGTSGIGRATAEAFVREGAKVCFCGRREKNGAEITEELVARGGEVLFVKADLLHEEDCVKVVEACVEHFGTIDVLFNCAGAGTVKPFLAYDMAEDYDKVLNLDLRAYFVTCREALKVMVPKGKGTIVNVSSIGGLTAMPMQPSYAAAKAGVANFTRTLAVEFAEAGIRANIISPGFTITEMVTGVPGVEDMLGSIVPGHKSGSAEGVANAAVFCASDETPFMTGAEIVIDGAVQAGACIGYSWNGLPTEG